MRRLLLGVWVLALIAAGSGSSAVGAEVTAAGNQLLTQRGPLAGTPEDFDQFGQSLAVGDFDGDGFDDAAIGVPSEDLGGLEDAGVVHVVYGAGAGVDVIGGEVFSQRGAVRGTPEAGDGFGCGLAAGDFDGDGFDDLAVSASGEDVGDVEDSGIVHLLFGGPEGLTSAGNQVWSQAGQVWGLVEADDRFGGCWLSSGDFDSDGFDDLVVSVIGEDLGTMNNAGVVQVLYGGSEGLTAERNQAFADPAGAWPFAGFAKSGVAADFDGDGYDDLALGDWAWIDDSVYFRGSSPGDVQIIYGSAMGLTYSSIERFSQAGPIKGTPEGGTGGDMFGASLAAGDFDSDGYDDLAVGVPGEGIGSREWAGMVNIIYGSRSGLTPDGNQGFSQAGPIIGKARAGEFFGGSLATGDLNADGYDDLAIGVRSDDIAKVGSAGATHVLWGSEAGLSSDDNQYLSQGDPIRQTPEPGDNFGSSVSAGDFNGDGIDDLLIGAPGEDLRGHRDAGAVHVLFGQAD